MRVWTVSLAPERCGRCGLALEPRSPFLAVLLPGTVRRIRCAGCAGEPVNHTEADLELARLEAERRPRLTLTPPAAAEPRPRRPQIARRRDGRRPTKSVFDPRAAAANDRE